MLDKEYLDLAGQIFPKQDSHVFPLLPYKVLELWQFSQFQNIQKSALILFGFLFLVSVCLMRGYSLFPSFPKKLKETLDPMETLRAQMLLIKFVFPLLYRIIFEEFVIEYKYLVLPE